MGDRASAVEQIASDLVKRMELTPLEDKVPHLSVIKPNKLFLYTLREDPFEPYLYGDGSLGGMFLHVSEPSTFKGEFRFVLRRAPFRSGKATIRGVNTSSLWRYVIKVSGRISNGEISTKISLDVYELSWEEDDLEYYENKIGNWEKHIAKSSSQVTLEIEEVFPEALEYFVFPSFEEARYLAVDLFGEGLQWVDLMGKKKVPFDIVEEPRARLRLLIGLSGNLFTLALINEGVSALVTPKRTTGKKHKKGGGVQVKPRRIRLSSFAPLGRPSETWDAGSLLEATAEIEYERVVRSHGPLWPKDVAVGVGGLYKAREKSRNEDGTYVVEIYRLADAQIEKENTQEVKNQEESLNDSIKRLYQEFLHSRGCRNTDGYENYAKALIDSLTHVIPPTEGVHRLRKFQYETCEKFVKLFSVSGLRATDHVPRSLAILATTASGKTLAFLIPILLSVGLRVVDGLEGATAVLVYPTRALAIDQARLIVKILWHLNKVLKDLGFRPIKLGILAGETPSLGRGEVETTVGYRFRHPIDNRPFRVKISRERNGVSFRYEYYYDDSGDELAPNDKRRLGELLSVVRDEIYAKPPDIIITTPDTLNLRLMDLPESHSILGREVKVCPNCKALYTNMRKRKCVVCKTDISKERGVSYLPPEIFVLDEVHQLRGSFGAQVSYVFSRLETAIREYKKDAPYSPLYVFSSATFRKPETGVQRFLRVKRGDLRSGENFYEIRPESKSTGEVSRIHIFIKPKVYSEVATLARTLERLGKLWEQRFGRKPKTIIFVNSISEVNLLLNTLKDRLPEYKIKGHSTDFEVERSRIEEEFSRCEVDILVATSGLEVGVDFDEVEVVVIFGAPNYLADYRQRIGRAGRSPKKRPALIIHIFKSRPVDYLYKRQFEIVYEEAKLNRYLAREEVPLAVENTIVRRRSAERAFFDYLATRPDSHEIYDEPLSKGRVGQNLKKVKVTSPNELGNKVVQEELDRFVYDSARNAIKQELVEYLGKSVSLVRGIPSHDELNDFEKTLLSLLSSLATYAEGLVLSEACHRDKFLRRLSSLRSSDESVDINFRASPFPNRFRTRELGIFLGKYYEKGIYSYMGVNLIVDTVQTTVLPEPDLLTPARVMEEQVPKPKIPAEDPDLTKLFSSRYLLVPREVPRVDELEEVEEVSSDE